MTRELSGQVAVVLGAGSLGAGWGIGKAVSFEFARAGAKVVAADVNAESAAESARLIAGDGGEAEAHGVDVTDEKALSRLLADAIARHGRIDILYCNVGLGKAGPSGNTSADDWRRITEANLTALHVATQAVVPTMRRQRSGVILTTSSVAGMRDVGYPHLAYGVTKAASGHFMRLVALENAAFGIRANTIVAGLVDTPRIEQTLARSYPEMSLDEMKAARAAQVPLGRMASAFDIAHAAVFLASARAGYITGTELVVDGGLTSTVNRSAWG